MDSLTRPPISNNAYRTVQSKPHIPALGLGNQKGTDDKKVPTLDFSNLK